MRKLALVLLAVCFIFGIAMAQEPTPAPAATAVVATPVVATPVVAAPVVAKDNVWKGLEVGAEWGLGQKNIEDYTPISLGIGGFLDGSIVLKTSDVTVMEELATVGYKLSDNLTPYVILGNSYLNFDQSLVGQITAPISASLALTQSDFKSDAFTYGIGARGNLLTLKNDIKVGYDLRWHTFSASDHSAMVLVPTIIGFAASDHQKVAYNEINMLTAVSKEFAIKNASDKWYMPKAITPMVGYRFSYVDMKKKDDVTVGPVRVGLETTVRGATNAGVLGIKAKMSDVLDIGATMDINNHIGGGVQATYRF